MQNFKMAPHDQILSTVRGFCQGHALGVATKLGIADRLSEGPVHVDDLASRTQTNASSLFRLLRATEPRPTSQASVSLAPPRQFEEASDAF
jgi:hypothetical protein